MKNERSAGAVVYYLNNNKPVFLLLQNTLKKTYWEFPKGKIEENESTEQTVLREVKEETGLKNLEIIKGFKQEIKWFFRFQGELIKKRAVYLLLKIPEQDKNKVNISNEHQKFKFMNYEQALKEINIKANKEMMKSAYNFIKQIEKQKKLF